MTEHEFPRMARTPVILLLALSVAGLGGCANMLSALVPDVYLVDRHTIMEADAAGDWPGLEQRLRGDIHAGPAPLAGIDEPLDRQPAFRVLDDEYPPHVN